MDRTKFVALAWGVVSLAGVTVAIATPPSGSITRTELAVGKVTDEIDIRRTEPSDFHIYELSLEPGAHTGWHTHPGPEYSIVKAGEIIVQRSPDCQERTVKAGQGVFIPAGTPHMAHNGGKEPAQIYETHTVPAGTTVLRVDADEACRGRDAPAERDAPAGEDAPAEDEPSDEEALD